MRVCMVAARNVHHGSRWSQVRVSCSICGVTSLSLGVPAVFNMRLHTDADYVKPTGSFQKSWPLVNRI